MVLGNLAICYACEMGYLDFKGNSMKTLDHWKSKLTVIPSSFEFPEMRLLTGRDHEPPVFVGSGHIDIKNSTNAEFKVFAPAPQTEGALLKVYSAHSNPYEMPDQFRLFATDFEGTEWACGWTIPKIEQASPQGVLVTGRITSMSARVSGEHVSIRSGVELLFQPSFHMPMEQSLLTVHSIGDAEVSRSWRTGKHSLQVLGSEIEFSQDPSDDLVWVTASASIELPHLFLENWLSEPLRIMLGQLHYPRLIARNFGDGSAFVSIRQSPPAFRNASIGSLLASEPTPPSLERFWQLYEALLKIIAKETNAAGHPDFQPHQITRFYEEIIQASQGSRWVWCLTLASAAEGLAKLLLGSKKQEAEFSAADVEEIKKVISAWKGDKKLKTRVLNSIAYMSEKTVGKFLGGLAKQQVIETRHESAWKSVRNRVMHGHLTVPWSTKEEDEHIISLAELVHTLTREIAGVGPRQACKDG
jgi:hypothetical protein